MRERPIPLSAPDGTVYAWACGECGFAAWPGANGLSRFVGDESDASRAAAERCCVRCPACRGELCEATPRLCFVCVRAGRRAFEALAAIGMAVAVREYGSVDRVAAFAEPLAALCGIVPDRAGRWSWRTIHTDGYEVAARDVRTLREVGEVTRSVPTVVVVSRHKDGTRAPNGAVVVYVGRAQLHPRLAGSPLANPFRIPRGYDVARDPVDILGRYRRWLDEALTRPASSQTVEIDRLADLLRIPRLVRCGNCWADWPAETWDKRPVGPDGECSICHGHGYVEPQTLALECWCAPKRCHADVIREVLIERLKFRTVGNA